MEDESTGRDVGLRLRMCESHAGSCVSGYRRVRTGWFVRPVRRERLPAFVWDVFLTWTLLAQRVQCGNPFFTGSVSLSSLNA
jgi:hypothetical protein